MLILLGLMATGIVCYGYAARPDVLDSFQNKLDDILLSSTATGLRSDRITIVDIDDRSLKELGQWPWPRKTLAALVDAIAVQNPLCVVLDMLFAEPDRLNDTNDSILAKSLAKTPTLLGYQFRSEQEGATASDCLLLPLRLTLIAPPGSHQITLNILTARSISCALPQLATASASEGFLNVFPDNDGVIRKVPLLMGWQSKLYPSLALAAALFALEDPPVDLHVSQNGVEQLVLKKQDTASASLRIPVDSYGQMTVNYRGRAQTFPHISALDILNHNSRQDFFNKKIVFIGTSAAGLADLRTTPLGTNVPGVEIQATATDNLLQGDYLHSAEKDFNPELIALLVTGLCTTLCCAFMKHRWRLLYILLYGAGLWFVSTYLISSRQLLVSPFYAYLCLLAVFLVLSPFQQKNTPADSITGNPSE